MNVVVKDYGGYGGGRYGRALFEGVVDVLLVAAVFVVVMVMMVTEW